MPRAEGRHLLTHSWLLLLIPYNLTLSHMEALGEQEAATAL